MSEITDCPICGAEIQATEELCHTQVVLNREGEVEHYTGWDGTVEIRVYCKNDHTHDEMMSHLRGDNTGRGVEIPTWTEN